MKLFNPGAVPSALVHVAALFASTDSTKPSINTVNIRRHGCRMIVEATDGHIAIQSSYETAVESEAIPPKRLDDGSIMIGAKPFTKAGAIATGGHTFRIDSPVLGVIEGANGPVDYRTVTVEPGNYPNLDQLWPHSFTNDLVLPIKLEPALVMRLCKVQMLLSKIYGTPGWCWSTNKANQPVGIEGRDFASYLNGVDNLRVRMLIMPIGGMYSGRPLNQTLDEISEDRQAEIKKMVDRGVAQELQKRSLKLSVLEGVAA